MTTEMQGHLDKIRSDAAECLLLSSLVPNEKREMFVRVAEHLNNLAFEVERTMAKSGAKPAATAHQPEPAGTFAAAPYQNGWRSRRILPWILAVVAAVIVGTFLWENQHLVDYSGLSTVPSKHQPQLASEDQAKQTALARVSREQGEHQIAERLGALAARVDDLERALDSLKKASGELAEWSTKEPVGAGDNHTAIGTKASAPEYKKEENAASSTENPPAAKPSGGVPPNPLNEPVDQVGTIAAPGKAELDRHIGPTGCSHFRSFDAASGTYTTLDGRRRPCR